jgi:hypothetical protein
MVVLAVLDTPYYGGVQGESPRGGVSTNSQSDYATEAILRRRRPCGEFCRNGKWGKEL